MQSASITNVPLTGIFRRKSHVPRRRRDPLQLPVALSAHRGLQYAPSSATPHLPLDTSRSKLTIAAYENGASALLLQLSGTIPVLFRGQTFGFPIAIWVPHVYPREPPIVYVIPSQDMLVRPGQHVSGDGRVYHPYLAQWGKYWDVSILSTATFT